MALPIPLPDLNLNLKGGDAGPSAAGGTTNNGFDTSGWAVSFGTGNATATGSTESLLGKTGGYLPYVLAGVGLLVVWRLTRKRKA